MLQIVRQFDTTNDIILHFAVKSESQRDQVLAYFSRDLQLMHSVHRDCLEATKC